MFTGTITALVTPFRNGKVDEKAFKNLIEFQIKGGVSGIVPCGTTGEPATLSYDEHDAVIEMAVKVARGRVAVIAGTGSNSTDEAIVMTRHAKKVGVDGSLQVTPYCNKPSQEGLYRHYRAIAEAVDLPMVLYNVPGRTGINLLPETVIRLSALKQVVAVKEASGVLDQTTAIIAGVRKRGFTVLSGDDSLTVPIMAVGGKGVISVASNIVPAKVSRMTTAALKGDYATAAKLHTDLFELMKTLFIETNPVPVKTALALMKMMGPELRLPLCELSKPNADRLASVLKAYRLIK